MRESDRVYEYQTKLATCAKAGDALSQIDSIALEVNNVAFRYDQTTNEWFNLYETR